MKTNTKIYSGIYAHGSNRKTDLFLNNQSQVQMDSLIAPYYLWNSLAHNFMLAQKGLVPDEIAKKILKELMKLSESVDIHGFEVDPTKGDIHENIESWLTGQIGSEAGWFHLARSRNDQITCDQMLITKELFFKFAKQLNQLGNILADKSLTYSQSIMPGYTHLRPAMPSSLGFWWQSYLVQLVEVQQQLHNVYELVDTNPLGAGAGYGVNWSIDPVVTTKFLGFNQPLSNSLAAINSRGIHELYWVGCLVTISTLLSRMMEDVIIWSMPELNLIGMSESYTSGSSIMPQKMNPDVAEKIRGKSGLLLGLYMQLAATLKGTPSGYNRDSADTKVIIITAFQESIEMISIANSLLASLVPNQTVMLNMTKSTLATKMADQLAQDYQIPFRQAHKSVGTALKLSQYDLDQLDLQVLQQAIKQVTGKSIKISDQWLDQVVDVNQALSLYKYIGSPAPEMVEKVTDNLKLQNKQFIQWAQAKQNSFITANKQLLSQIKKYLSEGK